MVNVLILQNMMNHVQNQMRYFDISWWVASKLLILIFKHSQDMRHNILITGHLLQVVENNDHVLLHLMTRVLFHQHLVCPETLLYRLVNMFLFFCQSLQRIILALLNDLFRLRVWELLLISELSRLGLNLVVRLNLDYPTSLHSLTHIILSVERIRLRD